MKRKMPVLCLLAAALVSLALLAGCGAKAQPVYITVVNRTTLPLADLRIKLVSEEDFGENRLETTLQEGETASIQLGRYTQDQLDGGCNLQFYDETGEPVYPEYDPDTVTLVESGNVFILAPPNLGVTLFVNTLANLSKAVFGKFFKKVLTVSTYGMNMINAVVICIFANNIEHCFIKRSCSE